jgi:hypothetical protein
VNGSGLAARSGRRAALDTVAGLLAAASIAASLTALAYRPGRLVPFAIAFALIAAGVGGRHSRLAFVAVVISVICFVGGMTVAVVTNNPIY